MANLSSIIQQGEAIATELLTITADLVIDQSELAAGGLVKVGQIGSTGGKPVYVYLSENPAAS